MPHDLPTLDSVPHTRDVDRARFVIDILLRHWILVLAFMMVGGAVGALVGTLVHQVRHEYAAQTDLVVKQSFWQSPALANLDAKVFGETTPTGLINRLDMDALAEDIAAAILQEDLAEGGQLGGLSTDDEMDKRTRQIVQSIAIEPFEDKGLLRVRTYSLESPGEALRLAEYTARGLIEHTQLQRLDEQQQAYALVQQQLDELRAQLDTAENAQWAFREEMGFKTHEQVWIEMEKMNAELLDADAMQHELTARIQEIDAELQENSRQIPGGLGNVTETVVQELLDDLDTLRGQELELSIVWTPEYPELARLQDDIAEKKEAVLLAINELNKGDGGSSLWKQRQELYRQKVDFRSQLMSYSVREASLQKTVDDFSKTLPELADQSFQYAQYAHESDQVRKQFNKLIEKEFELRTAMRRGTATVERRSAPAILPDSQTRQAPLTATSLLGALLGAVVALLYALLRELNDTSIRTTSDVNHYLRLEVIGTIPEMRFSKDAARSRRKRGAYVVSTVQDEVDASVVTQHDPKSPVSEAYRSLRTNFQFATLQHEPKAIMVTSSVPGEGKTTTAVNFAVTLADLGKRVVVVDTDLRRPNVHHMLHMNREKGLADTLRNQATLEEVIRPTVTQNLWVISSGRVPPNPSELIGSAAMKETMQRLTEQFDVVVCDAPSTLVVTDPVVLATLVDAIILVVAAGRARRETIQRAVKVLETAATPVAGAVLNGIKTTSRHYYYYYYYYDERARGRRRGRALVPSAVGDHAIRSEL